MADHHDSTDGPVPLEPNGDGELRGMEADPRFPSGPWTGFFLQREAPVPKCWMELDLMFREGHFAGTGRDVVGQFTIDGTYDTADGRCHFRKQYLRRHRVEYSGYNEGKGIWGTWEIQQTAFKGGFHIWPIAMGDPTEHRLVIELDIPKEESVLV